LVSAGAPLAFGSDWPVVTMNPFEAMRAALARPKLDFSATTSHFPDHRLTLSELIEGYTRAAAYAEFQERRKGQIMPGLLADVVALDQNWFDAPREELPAAIAGTRADLTIVGGRVVHNRL
jgi:predicted amidohydrolase YtcJ